MKPRNTLSKTEFVLYHLWWIVISWIWYKSLLFRCLGPHSLKESRWILAGLILICAGSGMLLEWKRQRNHISMAMNLLAAFGAYAALTYLSISRKLILAVMITAGILAAAYFVYMVCYRIGDRRNAGKILMRRIRRAAVGGRNILCTGMAFIMIFLVLRTIFGSSLVESSVSPARQAEVEEQTIANHMDTLVLLEDDVWEKLSVGDRLNVLQVVANIEQRYLGLPHELNVGVLNLRERLAGYYNDDRHEIIVSMDCLLHDSPFSLVDVIAHEAYHAVQCRMVDAYDAASDDAKPLIFFYDASVYKDEFANYTDGIEDFCGYYSQKCEADARDYAEEAAYEYYIRISEYLNSRRNPASVKIVKTSSD